MYGFLDVLLRLHTEVLGDDHAAAGGQAQEQIDDQVVERAGGTNGGHGVPARELAEHDDIGRVEQQLEYA